MKRAVTSFCLLISVLSTSIVAQTNERGAKKERQRASARSGNLQICQGLPLPDGCIIVGYVSSTTCPHGAYLLKKKESTGSDQVVTAHSQAPLPQASVAAPQNTASRPRRTGVVGDRGEPSVAANSEPGPPTLSGVEPRAPSGPPKLS